MFSASIEGRGALGLFPCCVVPRSSMVRIKKKLYTTRVHEISSSNLGICYSNLDINFWCSAGVFIDLVKSQSGEVVYARVNSVPVVGSRHSSILLACTEQLNICAAQLWWWPSSLTD